MQNISTCSRLFKHIPEHFEVFFQKKLYSMPEHRTTNHFTLPLRFNRTLEGSFARNFQKGKCARATEQFVM